VPSALCCWRRGLYRSCLRRVCGGLQGSVSSLFHCRLQAVAIKGHCSQYPALAAVCYALPPAMRMLCQFECGRSAPLPVCCWASCKTAACARNTVREHRRLIWTSGKSVRKRFTASSDILQVSVSADLNDVLKKLAGQRSPHNSTACGHTQYLHWHACNDLLYCSPCAGAWQPNTRSASKQQTRAQHTQHTELCMTRLRLLPRCRPCRCAGPTLAGQQAGRATGMPAAKAAAPALGPLQGRRLADAIALAQHQTATGSSAPHRCPLGCLGLLTKQQLPRLQSSMGCLKPHLEQQVLQTKAGQV
jgi:hypothetical protein